MRKVTSQMEMTIYDMERPAAMPMAAPVGAVAPGYRLAAANPLQVHGTFVPIARDSMGTSGKPWTGRPARHLGRAST
ncbi:MAG: hypothetical protein K0S92_1690 [Desertimonas sp.]|nr:hypothetical protein [Desertimonas sp.]